jgi:hypothetical protein
MDFLPKPKTHRNFPAPAGSLFYAIKLNQPKTLAFANSAKSNWFPLEKTKTQKETNSLFTELELLGDGVITRRIGVMEIIQQTTALTDHHQQTATGTMILDVFLQVLGKRVDALGQKSDLHIGRSGITFMQTKFFNKAIFDFHSGVHFLL